MCIHLDLFFLILDHFKTQKICERAVEVEPCMLKFVPDHHITQEMYAKAVLKER